jgi:hypothetical protein
MLKREDCRVVKNEKEAEEWRKRVLKEAKDA